MPKKRKAAAKKAPVADEEADYEVAEILGKRLNKDKMEYQVRWKGYGADADTWEPVSHLDGAEVAIEAYEAKLGLAKPKLSWPYAAARGEAADPTRTQGYHAPEASFKKGVKTEGDDVDGPSASSVQSSPQRTSESVTDKRASRWKSGRNVRVEYRIAWVDGDGDEQEEWVVEEKVQARGLQKLVDDYNRDHGNAEAKVVNTGAVLSRGSSRNLPAGMALPDAAGGAAGAAATGSKKGGKKPSSLVGTRTQEDIEEVKVKWADSAESTWMARAAFATKFGKPMLTKMTKSMQTFGDAAWSGSAITAKDAAKRWPNRYHSGAGGVKNWSAVTVDDVVIKLGDSVKVLVQHVDGTEDHEAFGVAIVEELWEDAGEKQFSARWCWRAQETILKTMATALCEDHIYAPDPRRVFIQKLPPVDDLDEVSNPHLIVIILSSTHSHLILTSSCHRRARIMNQAASMPTAAHSSSVKSPASTNMTSARRPPRSRTFTTI